MKQHVIIFLFERSEINLDNIQFFIIINQVYTGRIELPSEIKALSRLCAMVVPELLSKLKNYDWGFNYINSLLKQVGGL